MGYIEVEQGIKIFYEEFGCGENIIISAQAGFYHPGTQDYMAKLGYHVYCLTIRGFHPSTLITQDYGDSWYDIFAKDVISFADIMGINQFIYMGASHGAGIGWHLMLSAGERVKAFVAIVAGPHSLKKEAMSYRQMIEQGIIEKVPPFNPPIDNDVYRQQRRDARTNWINSLPPAPEEERRIDYKRPLIRLGSEEKLCEELKKIDTPTLLIGGTSDPISTMELMSRTAQCLPHCKLVVYSNCGHDIDTDLIEEVSNEADIFLKTVAESGKWYKKVMA